jgi:uncharacterized protein involved in exopolysaccharide biosynthesis
VYRSVDPDEIDLVEYLAVIWRHRWMIAMLCFVAMVLTVAWTLTRPRMYRSSTTIVPPLEILQKQSGPMGGLGAMGKSMLRSVIDTGSIADIYAEILKSREVSDAIIDRFDLMTVYKDVRFRSDVLDQLKRNTKIETTDQGAVKITVTDLDPNKASAIANAYVQELDRQNKRLSTGEATSKRIFLENRIKEVEAKLSQIDNIPTHEAKTQEMLYEMLVQEYEMAKIEEAKNMPTIQVLDEAVVPELPIARGTIRRGIVAGVAAFMVGVFGAFAREYIKAARRRRRTAISTGRYDINLPEGSSSPVETHGGSEDLAPADKTAVSTGPRAAGSLPAGQPKQEPKRR